MIATIRFIHELAEVYAKPGAAVRLIHGVVGTGVVLEMLPRSHRVKKVKDRYYMVGRKPSISANVCDVDGMDLLSTQR